MLGEVVLLPAQAGWGPFASSPLAPPTQASASVRRKPRQIPKWGGKLLTHWKNDIIFLLDLFLSLFMVQPHKHVPQCRTGDSEPHGPTTAEELLDEPQPGTPLTLLHPTQEANPRLAHHQDPPTATRYFTSITALPWWGPQDIHWHLLKPL